MVVYRAVSEGVRRSCGERSSVYMDAAGIAVISPQFQSAGAVFRKASFSVDVIFPLVKGIKAALGTVHGYGYVCIKGAVAVACFIEV